MATTATPSGAEPVNTLSASGSFSGKVRHIKIASNYGTAIFYGDFVKLVAAGTVEKLPLQHQLLRVLSAFLWDALTLIPLQVR